MHDPTTRKLALRLMSSGLTIAEVHRQTGVPQSTLGYWRKHPERPAAPVRAPCPRCHDRELDQKQYTYLLGLYLGDGHIVRTHRQGVYRLEIACADVWPGLIDRAAEAISDVMPGHKVGRRQTRGCAIVGFYSSHLPCLFPQHGPGRKHERRIALAAWQQELVDEHPEDFVRGLIHSDGCRSINQVRRSFNGGERWYEYPRYNFTNVSLDIQRLFTDALDRLGIAWTQMNRKNISVARREAVARLDEFVGPKY